MVEANRQYRIDQLDIESVNAALSLIVDRFDELQGQRGVPSFFADVDLLENRIINLANAIDDQDGIPLSQLSQWPTDIIPSLDNTYDLGSPTFQWQDLFLSGNLTISSLTANRVIHTGTGGVLIDDANFTWDGSTLAVGGGTGIHTFNGSDYTSTIEVHEEGAANLAQLTLHRHADGSDSGSFLVLLRSNNTHASPTIVADNDVLGNLLFAGYDGDDYAFGASIRAVIEGTPAENDMPCSLEFWTTPTTSDDPVKRLTIHQDGQATSTNTSTWTGGDVILDAGKIFATNSTSVGDAHRFDMTFTGELSVGAKSSNIYLTTIATDPSNVTLTGFNSTILYSAPDCTTGFNLVGFRQKISLGALAGGTHLINSITNASFTLSDHGTIADTMEITTYTGFDHSYDRVSGQSITIENCYGARFGNLPPVAIVATNLYGIYVEPQTRGLTLKHGIAIEGNGLGSDIAFGNIGDTDPAVWDSYICHTTTTTTAVVLIEGLNLNPLDIDADNLASVIIGDATDGVDYQIYFDGNAEAGIIRWLEDEQQFIFTDGSEAVSMKFDFSSANQTTFTLQGQRNIGTSTYAQIIFENTDSSTLYQGAMINTHNDAGQHDGDLRFHTNSNGLNNSTDNLMEREVISSDGDKTFYGNKLQTADAINAVTINGGGTDYSANDILTLAGGTFGTVSVDSVTGGVIDSVTLVNSGYGHTTGSKAVTGGTGNDDATVTINSIKTINTQFRDSGLYITSSIDGQLDIVTDGNVTIGDGGTTDYTNFASDGSISQIGTARINWTKITANNMTQNVNDGNEVGDVTDIQTARDGTNFYQMPELAAQPGIDIEVEFINVTAFNWVNIIAQYAGGTTHDVTIQLYNFNTTQFETFAGMSAQGATVDGTDITFSDYSFFVPDDTDFIGTAGDAGDVRIRIVHIANGNANHDLFIDVVALYQ